MTFPNATLISDAIHGIPIMYESEKTCQSNHSFSKQRRENAMPELLQPVERFQLIAAKSSNRSKGSNRPKLCKSRLKIQPLTHQIGESYDFSFKRPTITQLLSQQPKGKKDKR